MPHRVESRQMLEKQIFKNLIEWKVVKGLQVIAMSRIELKAEKILICGWTGV